MIKKKLAQLHAKPGGGGIIYSIVAYSLWGILPIYWKAMKQIPASDILAHRIFWSFLLLIAFVFLTKKRKEFRFAFSSFKIAMAVLAASFLISINWLIYIWSVNNNHIVEASLGYYINPLFTIILGIIVLRERPDAWQVLAIVIAAAGVGFMAFQYNKIPWVALSLAVSFGLYGLAKKLSKLSSLTGLAAETTFLAPFAFVFLFVQVNDASGIYTNLPYYVILLILLSGLATSIPLLLFAQGAKRVPMSTLGFLQYLSPSISLILGIFMYKEPFTYIEKISFGCIWLALSVYSISRKEVLIMIRQKINLPEKISENNKGKEEVLSSNVEMK